MIILDKIKKVLFTEVDEEEDTYVEELPSEQPLEKVHMEKSVVHKKPVKVKSKPVSETVEPVFEKTEKMTNIDIKVDIPIAEKKVEKRLKPIERKEFEIPQVISPISGLKADEQQEHAEYLPTTKPKNRKDSLGTVISPYYGDFELEEFESKAQMELASAALTKTDIDLVDDEDIENVSLDQIVSPQLEEEDEMIQFSLFGDNASLRDIVEQESLSEETVEDETSKDDLPF